MTRANGQKTSRAKRAPNNGGSISRDKQGRYVVAVMLPDGRRKYVRRRTEAEAVTERNRLLGAIAANTEIQIGRAPTVADELERFCTYTVAARELAPATRDNYRWAADVLSRDALGGVRLDVLTPRQVEAALARLAPRHTYRSVGLMRKVLAMALDVALRDKRIARNEARLALRPGKSACKAPAAKRALSVLELRALLEAAGETDARAILVRLAVDTGARRGELLGLSWSAVDLERGTAQIVAGLRRADVGHEIGAPKTQHSYRTIALEASTVAMLRAHRVRQLEARLAAGPAWSETGLVFTSEAGTGIDPANFRRYWLSLMARAGLEGVTLHELRHTAISHAIYTAGVPIGDVAQAAGNSVEVISRNYAHRIHGEASGITGAMAAALAGAGAS